jgi:drug/metabolite transporter (DMT)-like permease
MFSAPSQESDGRAGAILLVLAAAFVFAASDVAAKLVVGRLPPLEVLWLRSLIVLALTLPVLLWRRGLAVIGTRHPFLQLVRGCCVTVASLLFLMGLMYLPVADASAINFIWPVLVTVFSVILLGEKVGLRRFLATLAGFAGMLIIMRPGSGSFHPAAVFPLGAAVAWAFGSVLTRMMSADDRAETTILWSAVVAFAIGALAMPFVFVMPTPAEFGLCILIGLGSAIAHAMIVFAFSKAPASALAPYSYTQLIWAAAAGWLVFGSLPDGWTIVGAAVIAASGVYTAHRERVRMKSAATP